MKWNITKDNGGVYTWHTNCSFGLPTTWCNNEYCNCISELNHKPKCNCDKLIPKRISMQVLLLLGK